MIAGDRLVKNSSVSPTFVAVHVFRRRHRFNLFIQFVLSLNFEGALLCYVDPDLIELHQFGSLGWNTDISGVDEVAKIECGAELISANTAASEENSVDAKREKELEVVGHDVLY